MDLLRCQNCGKLISEVQQNKARWQNRIPKYCSVRCWGQRPRQHAYDHTFLDQDNELAAYFTGWWTADGHIDEEGTLSVTCTDKQLVDDFLKRINYHKSVSIRLPKNPKRKIQYSFSMAGNARKRIEEMGYARGAKGGSELFPERFYNEEYFFHFLRGFIDGDGSIRVIKKNGALSVSMVSMSAELLADIFDFLYDRRIVRGGALLEPRDNYFVLIFGHFDSVQICKYLYENHTICLDRKYQNYLRAKDHVQGCVPQTNTCCAIPGCLGPSQVIGLCKKHYDRSYRITYCAENKEKISKRMQKWRLANLDRINARRRVRYKQNPEKYREQAQKWRENHPEEVKRYKKQYDTDHRPEINAYKREVRKKDPDHARELDHASYLRNKENKLAQAKQYKQEHQSEIDRKNAEYRDKNRELIRQKQREFYQKNKERRKAARMERYYSQKANVPA